MIYVDVEVSKLFEAKDTYRIGVETMPRADDLIEYEPGHLCVVRRVEWRINPNPWKTGSPTHEPVVLAVAR